MKIKLVKKSADPTPFSTAEKKCICSWLPLVTRGAFSSSFSMKEGFPLFRGLPGCFLVTRMDGPHRYTDRAQLLPKRFSRRVQAEDQGQCGCSGSEAGTQREGKGWAEGSEGLSSNLASFGQGLCGLWYVTLCATALPPQGKLWLRMAPTGITWGANLNPVKCSAQPHPQPVSTWHLGSHLHFFSFADPVVPRFLWWAA